MCVCVRERERDTDRHTERNEEKGRLSIMSVCLRETEIERETDRQK